MKKAWDRFIQNINKKFTIFIKYKKLSSKSLKNIM